MSCFAKVAVCFTLLFALANGRSFEDIVHSRGLKAMPNCPLVYAGTDWSGGDINPDAITGIGSATDCCYHCNRSYGSRVIAYIYRTDFDHCWCKHTVNPPSQCTACQGHNGGEYRPRLPCRAQYNYDSFGNDLPGMPIEGVTQPSDCCDRCTRHEGCVSWVWRRDFNRCYLKSSTVTLTSCPQCVFGRPYF